MTITPDQAKTLLDNVENTGRWYADYDDEADATRLYDMDKGEKITDGGSWTLAASAPDLARTVIAQAEQIERLTWALWIEQNQDPGDL